MRIERRHLEVVIAIAEAGSISKAAAELAIAQPALSAQLSRIERTLGGPLFERGSRGSTPTAGFDQDCTNGVAGYFPWVEMYPAASDYFTETVKPGDQITASVSVSGTTFTLAESDPTQGWTKTFTETGSDQLSSAEAIVEDLGSRIPPVADFGAVTFTGLTVNGAQMANAGTVNPTDIARKGVPLTSNSPLTGATYTISWLHS
jgi:hypothetical protein